MALQELLALDAAGNQTVVKFDPSTVPAPGTAQPQPAGTAGPGSSPKYAREDHTHPSQYLDPDTRPWAFWAT